MVDSVSSRDRDSSRKKKMSGADSISLFSEGTFEEQVG
jgi:hypothetical protein